MTSPFLTLEEFLEYNRLTAKTARIHVMFKCRCGKIPGAVKRMGKWFFDKRKIDSWSEAREGL